ncbi:MAG: TonB-dependent receptor [Flavobacteriales bacterium]|nr:TonB-dependent receptor [Flavobacteriales bacterium]
MKFLQLAFFIFLSSFCFGQNSSVSGKIKDFDTSEPVPFALVSIQGLSVTVTADIDGLFVIQDIAPGFYNLEISALGYEKYVVFELEITRDRPAEVEGLLRVASIGLKEVEIKASSISRSEESPLSARSIGTSEIKRNPGGGRDISKVIRVLPGVAIIPTFRNDIIIRGGAANENRFYIDGIEIPNINHFATQGASGGPVGLINVDLINEVEFYSGSFPVARGNALSSLMEFSFKEPRTDKRTLNMVVGSSDLGVTVEGPTGAKSGMVLSVRRSYLQALFALLELPFLPTYNDYNLKWSWRPDDRNKITIISLGALDDFNLNLKLKTTADDENFLRNRYLLENLVTNKQWNYTIGTRWDNFRENSSWSVVVSRNMLQNEAFKYINNDESLSKTFDYVSREQENKIRIERKLFPQKGWRFLYGLGLERSVYSNRSAFADFNPLISDTVFVNYRSDLSFNKAQAFFQLSKSLFNNKVTMSGGMRTDVNDFGSEMRNPLDQLSPRISLKWQFKPNWSFNAGSGIYYQLPPYTALGFRSNDVLVNTGMKYIRNDQLAAGIQFDSEKSNRTITLEGFYKKYSQYPISVLRGISLANFGADFGVIGNEDLSSSGLGRAYGLELLLRQKLYNGFYGIVAYTFVRSEFTGVDGKYVASSWDSRHLLSMTGGVQLKRNYEVGFRFAYSGGLPYTPDSEEASLDVSTWDAIRVGIPDYTRLNSQRIESFHQLDVRVDKKWYFAKWTLNLFLDIQNVYNNVIPLKPTLDVLRDENGNPIVDPNNASRYLPNYLVNSNNSVLPSIGLIIEL